MDSNAKPTAIPHSLKPRMIVVPHLNNSRSRRTLWLLEELGLEYEIRKYRRDPKTMLAARQFWSISCLPTLKNDVGQGFKAVAPDGTQYYFDWLAKFSATTMHKSDPGAALMSRAPVSGASGAAAIRDPGGTPMPNAVATPTLPRYEVWLLVSKVVDRFGNTVTYTYDRAKPRNLTRIESSDNRVITLSYTAIGTNDVVQSVNDGSRTWTYSYHGSLPAVSLDTVGLPDGSSWGFTSFDPILARISFINDGGCDALPAIGSGATSGQIRHPGGATATFKLAPMVHGRSGIERQCVTNMSGEKLYIPRYFATQSLTAKTINGPGLSGMTWTYDYGPRNESWNTCSNCPASKTVSVTDADGFVSRYTYGNRYQQNEARLELTELGWNGSSALRTVAQRYRAYGAGPYPNFMGYGDVASVGDGDMNARLAPVDQRVITQQGATFTWEATSFNIFAQATSLNRASSLGPSRVESIAYDNNLAKWMLGQITSVTESSGKVMVNNAYNQVSANLESVSRFGRLYQSMTYNTDGTLATRSDPLSYVTNFSNYKRGIPQNVGFPDGGTANAVVNNIGGIDSTTDAYGSNTSYRYDPMGRLNRIIYPTNDTVAWNDTIVAFSQVGVDEYGVAAGHWRQTVSTGNAQTIEYYDALWRPLYSYTADVGNPATTSRMVKRSYDSAGRTTFVSYPQRDYGQIAGGVTTAYDALGRVTRVSADSDLGVLNTYTAYSSPFQKTVTDARGNNTTSSFHAFDEPSESAIARIVAPEGVMIDIARDVFGKPTAITRSGGAKSATRSYVYDDFQRLCTTIEPETGATVQDYDAGNNIAWRATGLARAPTSPCDTSVAEASKMKFDYDPMNRLKTTVFGDGSPGITRTYTLEGLPETVSTSNGVVWTNTYNKRGLNVRESMAYGGATYYVDRAYDANAALRQLTYPDLASVDFAPNALGEPTRAGTFASAVSYHPNGAIAGFTYGNGIVHTLTQNARGLPEVSRDAGVLNDKYLYDENANVKSIADQQENISNRAMTYDNLDRLTGITSAPTFGVITNSYDALDNLTNVMVTQGPTARSTTHNFDPSTNRLTSISSATGAYNLAYGYDSQGNITTRGSQGFVFDQGNRLTSATGKATYAYDGLGHRVSTVGVDGINRVSAYTQGGQLLYTRATSVPLAAGTKYIYLGRHQVAEVKAAGAN